MFGTDNIPNNRINHYKIVALYIQLFLEKPIFNIRLNRCGHALPSANTLLMNELFCFVFMRSVIVERFKKQFDAQKYSKEYENFFLKLFFYYKNNKYRLASLRGHFHFTYALADIIRFIERDFFMLLPYQLFPN